MQCKYRSRLAERNRTTLKVTENYQKKLHKSDTKVKKSKYEKIHIQKFKNFKNWKEKFKRRQKFKILEIGKKKVPSDTNAKVREISGKTNEIKKSYCLRGPFSVH